MVSDFLQEILFFFNIETKYFCFFNKYFQFFCYIKNKISSRFLAHKNPFPSDYLNTRFMEQYTYYQ